MKKLSKRDEFPKEPHYAIIEFGQRHEDGGYKDDPGWLTADNHYFFTFDKAEWEATISRMTLDTGYGRKEFVAFKSNPVTIVPTISVNIKE